MFKVFNFFYFPILTLPYQEIQKAQIQKDPEVFMAVQNFWV